ncbi:nucleotidyl transferase AbiEii/AbiGii toxin family protein [Corynebacterium uberis]|uniref:nucleotidyl transferase AbiEii/AbiGii toxin family protein n=1 Tax=Corynebacterium TaxID=1716 RepID=UPI001D0AD30A|nr:MULTISPECIES: nucleotidyl transferase AbiEii/AbiGii toxin family protein [Corynebacterium]MCZ9309742.1 nucleotidyl transferase AbiEii/AbiGii toxin family protein [Corynebacterium sp. c6VSa_13]UDL74799.1 nucleotidyl transferase AbiEii/AbiGii toxin family protein [Corynebacterium uberis]UDL77012.1 nucleotidyl transferase AbiEii/AbiGii toxin family protein [Corynebacterium uberis]UDL81428.1 nucleotidyl transferase AbiEii/AbiGii toxin family protein [Corynebacterium uberis]UDL83641.1 nucleotidy
MVMAQKPKARRTHGKISSALKEEAKSKGKSVTDAYNQFFRETFLNLVMESQSGWVLKGGSGIYCRIPGARQTKDLDLYRQENPTSSWESAEILVDTMNGKRTGPYEFRLSHPKSTRSGGAVESERISVSVRYGVEHNELVHFTVDVSGDIKAADVVEPLTVSATFEVVTEFLPQEFFVYVYPVANQMADKVCAMYERYGSNPPGKPSTRYRDLYDLALMARSLSVKYADLKRALDEQQVVRRFSLPSTLVVPDDEWLLKYPEIVRGFGNVESGLDNIEEALRVAGLLLNPLLCVETARRNRTWDHRNLMWIDEG